MYSQGTTNISNAASKLLYIPYHNILIFPHEIQKMYIKGICSPILHCKHVTQSLKRSTNQRIHENYNLARIYYNEIVCTRKLLFVLQRSNSEVHSTSSYFHLNVSYVTHIWVNAHIMLLMYSMNSFFQIS